MHGLMDIILIIVWRGLRLRTFTIYDPDPPEGPIEGPFGGGGGGSW